MMYFYYGILEPLKKPHQTGTRLVRSNAILFVYFRQKTAGIYMGKCRVSRKVYYISMLYIYKYDVFYYNNGILEPLKKPHQTGTRLVRSNAI